MRKGGATQVSAERQDSWRNTSPELKVGEGQARWTEQLKPNQSGLEFTGPSVWDCKWGELGHGVIM